MKQYDFTPFYRATVGFDRLFEALSDTTANGYPPYNIVKLNDDEFRIEVAVAGFTDDEIDVTVHERQLTITGEAKKDEAVGEYLHKGISNRNFDRTFTLGEYVEVKSASVKDGILTVALARNVPEAAKPRKIAIDFQK